MSWSLPQTEAFARQHLRKLVSKLSFLIDYRVRVDLEEYDSSPKASVANFHPGMYGDFPRAEHHDKRPSLWLPQFIYPYPLHPMQVEMTG